MHLLNVRLQVRDPYSGRGFLGSTELGDAAQPMGSLQKLYERYLELHKFGVKSPDFLSDPKEEEDNSKYNSHRGPFTYQSLSI